MSPTLKNALLDWYLGSRRELPWRQTRDPYAIWVSEIMLQQTQVATVIPYYRRWMERFPDLESLARADEQEVLSLWQGLGYYRRCRMLQQGARYVLSRGLPVGAREWLEVPGVGAYTAAAVASIAQGEAAPLVDGNVERVFSRLTACHLTGRDLHQAAWKWAAEVLHRSSPGDWNQAIMELGATVCTPRSPSCEVCPVAVGCMAQAANLQHQLPRPAEKPAQVQLEFVVWVLQRRGRYGLRQIPAGQWWAGMWEFPRATTADELVTEYGHLPTVACGVHRHAVTHHRITLQVFGVEPDRELPSLRWFDASDLERLPLPAPQRKALAMVQTVSRSREIEIASR